LAGKKHGRIKEQVNKMAGYWDIIKEVFPYIATIGGGYLAGQGGGSPSVSSYQSPQQAATYAQVEPLLQKLMQSGITGQNAYGIPSISSMMPPSGPQVGAPPAPTSDWYNKLSPEVMAGVRQPYEDASRQLTESLGYSSGSAMGGASGMLGGAQADFWSKAGTQMGNQAWCMMQPGLMEQYGAQNISNQAQWNAMQGANTAGW